MAQSGHPSRTQQCPLLGVKRTSRGMAPMSGFDPKRTLSLIGIRDQSQTNPSPLDGKLPGSDPARHPA